MKILKVLPIFLSGVLLMLSLSFYFDWKFEEEVLNNLSKNIKLNSPHNLDSLIIHAMNTANYLECRNTEIFGSYKFQSFKVNLISPSFAALDYGGGDCGSYTLFLARLLKKMGFRTKIVGVFRNKSLVGHITLGIERDNKLLLIDPLYNHAFTDSLGHLSDIHEVAANWSTYYSKHLPTNYKSEYNYQSGWRYTNWDKYGLLSHSVYNLGSLFVGKSKMNNLSIRYYLLGLDKFYSLFAFSGFLFFIGLFFGFNKRKSAIVNKLKDPIIMYRRKMRDHIRFN